MNNHSQLALDDLDTLISELDTSFRELRDLSPAATGYAASAHGCSNNSCESSCHTK